MDEKTTTKVLIDGKIMTLGGPVSEEYLQKVSYYINGKIDVLKEESGYSRLPQDTRSTLLALQIADDYFQAKERVESLEADIEKKDRDSYDLRQKLVSLQMENDKLQQEIAKKKESPFGVH